VIPEKDAVGFYRKCGLNEVLMELQSMETGLEGFPGVNDEEVEVAELVSFEALKTMHMVYGRYDSSFGQWLKKRWKFFVWPSWSRWEEGFVPSCDGAYRIESDPIRKEACNLLAWTENPSLSPHLLQLCAKRAKNWDSKD